MAKESFVVTRDFKTPFVQVTGMPHKPQALKFKTFRKGEIVNGELKHVDNKPSFIMVGGRLVVPIDAVQRVVTKEVVSNADGSEEKKEKKSLTLATTNPKMKYLDAMIIGAIVGVGGVYLAEKQGWITEVDKKNKLYGALAGVIAGAYFVYRFQLNKPKEVKKTEE